MQTTTLPTEPTVWPSLRVTQTNLRGRCVDVTFGSAPLLLRNLGWRSRVLSTHTSCDCGESLPSISSSAPTLHGRGGEASLRTTSNPDKCVARCVHQRLTPLPQCESHCSSVSAAHETCGEPMMQAMLEKIVFKLTPTRLVVHANITRNWGCWRNMFVLAPHLVSKLRQTPLGSAMSRPPTSSALCRDPQLVATARRQRCTTTSKRSTLHVHISGSGPSKNTTKIPRKDPKRERNE